MELDSQFIQHIRQKLNQIIDQIIDEHDGPSRRQLGLDKETKTIARIASPHHNQTHRMKERMRMN
eukprot:scaffold6553_cov123-Alexandrium_tamarense.AAC.2